MHAEVRLILILVVSAMLVKGWFAKTAISSSARTVRDRRRSEGTLRHCYCRADDGADALPSRDGLRGSGRSLLIAIFCAIGIAAFTLGRGEASATFGWNFSPMAEGGIVVHAPASEVKAPQL